MRQLETIAANRLQEFINSYNQATQSEKRRLLGQLLTWAKEQEGLLQPKSPGAINLADPGDQQDGHPQKNKPAFGNDIRELIEKEVHLNQIAKNIEQVFWLSEVNTGRILYVSPAFEKIWGSPSEKLLKNPSLLIESVHPEDRVQVLTAIPVHDFKPFNQVYRILRPDGSTRWIFAHTFLIYDVNSEPYALFCLAQDISDQKQVELELRNTLNRTREQFNLSHKMSLSRKPEAVLKTLMSAHELRSAQRAALLFFEDPKIGPARGVELIASWRARQTIPFWSSESSLYEDPAFLKLFHPSQTVTVADIQSNSHITPELRELLIEGLIHTMVVFPLKAAGNWLGSLVVYYHQEVRFNHSELRHLKVLIDQATITLFNLKLLVVEEESRHEAERANEVKTEFLAMISHELRTPLTSIIGFTTTLLAKDVTWQPDEQQDFIQTIQQEANRLQELIDHLLDLSRLEAGMLPIVMKPESLHEILRDASPQLQTLTKGQNYPSTCPPDCLL